jgi:hypothetical protein
LRGKYEPDCGLAPMAIFTSVSELHEIVMDPVLVVAADENTS